MTLSSNRSRSVLDDETSSLRGMLSTTALSGQSIVSNDDGTVIGAGMGRREYVRYAEPVFTSTGSVSDFHILKLQDKIIEPMHEEILSEIMQKWQGTFLDDIPHAGLGSSTSIPSAIGANWYAIYQSGLPNSVFTRLMVGAGVGVRKRQLAPKALSTFLTFWKLLGGECAEPTVSISPKGDVVAEWFLDPDNVLVVMAHRDEELHFCLFDEGMPVEGRVLRAKMLNFIRMMSSRTPNPFWWSDADEVR